MIFLKYYITAIQYLVNIIDDFFKPSTLALLTQNTGLVDTLTTFFFVSSALGFGSTTKLFINNLSNSFYHQYNQEVFNALTNAIHININNNFWFFRYVQKKTEINVYKYNVVFINFIINSAIFLVFTMVFFNFFNKLLKKLNSYFFLTQRFVKEHDQEVTSFEDALIFVVFFMAFFINTFNLFSNKELIQINYHSTTLILLFFFYTVIVLVPVSIIFSAGSNFLTYLKGVDKTNSLSALIMFDLINVLAFFLRFFLQIIRWCLFLTTYYLLHEFVFE